MRKIIDTLQRLVLLLAWQTRLLLIRERRRKVESDMRHLLYVEKHITSFIRNKTTERAEVKQEERTARRAIALLRGKPAARNTEAAA